jgi:hypothetical protein
MRNPPVENRETRNGEAFLLTGVLTRWACKSKEMAFNFNYLCPMRGCDPGYFRFNIMDPFLWRPLLLKIPIDSRRRGRIEL